MSTRPLAVTMGDPAGIGPELIVKAWLARETGAVPPFVVYGGLEPMVETAWRLGIDLPIARVDRATDAAAMFAGRLPIVAVPMIKPVVPGRPDIANAAAVVAAIRAAVVATLGDQTSAVVTAPIAKAVLYEAGFPHPGHTEFLAVLADELRPERQWRPVMMLASPDLRVVPTTIHIPVSEVPEKLSMELIETTIRITVDALVRDFAIPAPRVAVAGLNPHAGEQGSIGTEDRDIIAPVVGRLRDEGLNVIGPMSADTMFHPAARARYDVAVAMYHDQALIPIKTIAFDEGVNVTLGLPFVRTSPDHGTAFDIAGKGVADPTSFLAALRLAAEIGARRSDEGA